MTEETRLEYVDEFSEPAGVPAGFVILIVPDLRIGRAILDDGSEHWFRLRPRVLYGAAMGVDNLQAVTDDEKRAFVAALEPPAKGLGQPARGVRATSSGVLRLVK